MSVSAIIRSHQDERIVQCIDDLRRSDGNHEIVAVLTETSDSVRRMLEGMQPLTIVSAPVGNLAISSNIGIEASRHDRFAILDSDVRCSDHYLDIVDRALDDHLLVKTKYNCLWRNFHERLVAELRNFTNRLDLFYCPGVAFRRELKDIIGGHFFNNKVWWSDDAEMNFRAQKAGLLIYRENGAVVTHDPENINHDLKGAYEIGRGKFAQVLHAHRDTFEENMSNVLGRILSGESASALVRLAQQESVLTALYSIVWQTAYLSGYYRERVRHFMKNKTE